MKICIWHKSYQNVFTKFCLVREAWFLTLCKTEHKHGYEKVRFNEAMSAADFEIFSWILYLEKHD